MDLGLAKDTLALGSRSTQGPHEEILAVAQP
jgi:hypothetical protein